MEEIEDKLKSYRMRKRREEKIRQTKTCIKSLFNIMTKNESGQINGTLSLHNSETSECLESFRSSHETDGSTDNELLSSEDEIVNKEPGDSENLYMWYLLRFVYVAFWFTLYVIAIELQFGIVFLMFSALIGIYLNTRTGQKKHNEISAYSVFNKNCESIDGTLKAEQFEREIGINL